MVQFRKCKYSVNPKYIGEEVDIEISGEDGSLQIYHNNKLIFTHAITINHLNYHKDDKSNILKSDVYSHKSDEEIKDIMSKSIDHLFEGSVKLSLESIILGTAPYRRTLF